MGYNLLRHASLGLYNHFNTHEAEYHDTIFNHCSDVFPYRYVCVYSTKCWLGEALVKSLYPPYIWKGRPWQTEN